MDCVDEFRIELDIRDRKKLHDYATQQTITRLSTGEWNYDDFSGLGQMDHISEDDENTLMMVKLMDDAILDKRLLERKAKDKEEKNKEVIRDDIFGNTFGETSGNILPGRVLPMYNQGEPVRGTVVLKLNKELAADKLKISFLGQSTVNMRMYHRYGYYDDTEHEVFVNEEMVAWEKIGGETKSVGSAAFTDISPEFHLLEVGDTPSTSAVLNPGQHKFRFEFAIPKDGPQSVPPLLPSTTNYAYLIYRFKASIDMGKCFARGNIVTHKAIWVEREVDIGSESSNLEPVASENILDTGVFLKSGRVVIRASLPRAGFVKGEAIPLSLEVDNQSKSEIREVKARIKMGGKAKVGFSRVALSHTIKVKSTKICEGPIGVGMNPSYQLQLPWEFMESSVDGTLLPVGDMDDSKLIGIKYHVVIELKRKGLHRNMELQIPITVGNKNSSS